MSEEIRNLRNKLICTISNDQHTITIKRGDCETIITANPDGTFNFEHSLLQSVA